MNVTNWITLLAAVIAALASVANVLLTHRGANRNEREKWRRQEAGAIAARIVTTTRSLRAEWSKMAENMDLELVATGKQLLEARTAAQARRDRARELDQAIQTTVVELELLTESREVTDAAHALLEGFEAVWHALRPGGSMEKFSTFLALAPAEIDTKLDALVGAVRADLGIKRLDQARN
ncbi:hypothetical protein M8542_46425 [Amycolatopsis sp. OK19-0408]|uniref:Uncharacterized protein n=1 Tax=Amycolatopsis iheyensis TaxID=2945988 RepID=A0A9X2SQV2_9PSEU|nr:hypothetical protein [Amycolatopsis iheyensis]MCR6490268.1 hypothetical protein [Amycolatopsis iheyensis]